MRFLGYVSAALLFFGFVPLRVGAQVPQPEGTSALVLEQFDVATDGDVLLVPVDLKGKRFLFLLDTGTELTVYDSSLRPFLGEPSSTTKAETPTGIVSVPMFPSPKAFVGKLNLSVSEEVPTFDLTEVRKGTGYTVSGVIGMDFLRRYVIRIDFDNGKLVFLRSADHQQGVSIPLRDGPGHVPHVVADVAGIQKQSFIVDTGACGYGSCIVTTSLFDRLIQAKSLTLLGNRLVSSANGTVKSREGKLKNVSLGQFQHDDLVCGESLFQILGLEYWSRFVVTFDFPGQKMYLDKGKRYGHADSWNVSGLHIIRNDGSTVVHSVDEGSPAAACNIKSKDVILQVGTTKATDVSLFTLHHLLAVTDQAIPIIVRRGDLEIHSSLDLRKLPASPAK